MKKKILVIDDEKTIRVLLENYLKKNYDVITKSDGEEGLNWMQEGNFPDLIVVDVQMPNLDGYEFIKNVRASGYFKEIPMIMLSGIESSAEKVKTLKMGANDYMVKPFNPEELEVRIELHLARK
ncbi:MAG: response regulator transcription factor [Bacteroidota bacterium]